MLEFITIAAYIQHKNSSKMSLISYSHISYICKLVISGKKCMNTVISIRFVNNDLFHNC